MEFSDFLLLLEPATRRGVVERAYAKGERLFSRGDAPRFIFYICSGEARLLRSSPAGVEVIFQRASRGFFAEASLEQPAYHCDGVAAAQTHVIATPIASFRAALADERVRLLWLRHLSDELRRVRAHSERLALRAAGNRILHYIETEGHGGSVVFSLPKKSWAAEMGLTHEALYRTLAAMQKAGVLSVSGNVIRLTGTETG